MQDALNWLNLPDRRVAVSGLPWYSDNWPRLWRLPADLMERLPVGVRGQAVFPAGARLSLITDSTSLHLKARSLSGAAGQAQGLDLHVDGNFWHTVPVTAPQTEVVRCFAADNCQRRRIDLYLPYRHEVEITELAVDAVADLAPPPAAAPSLVLYGSSVAQGAGASRATMAYGTILARRLGLDLVNLGFGGAGRAEPDVVDLVGLVEARCYLLDLGKSYGRQDAAPYAAMLERLHAARPSAPLVCITPIYSSREVHSAEYADLSQHTRDVVRQAVDATHLGTQPILVEGLDLLGPDDADGLSADGVHPSDLGFQRMAERLEPILRKALSR